MTEDNFSRPDLMMETDDIVSCILKLTFEVDWLYGLMSFYEFHLRFNWTSSVLAVIDDVDRRHNFLTITSDKNWRLLYCTCRPVRVEYATTMSRGVLVGTLWNVLLQLAMYFDDCSFMNDNWQCPSFAVPSISLNVVCFRRKLTIEIDAYINSISKSMPGKRS